MRCHHVAPASFSCGNVTCVNVWDWLKTQWPLPTSTTTQVHTFLHCQSAVPCEVSTRAMICISFIRKFRITLSFADFYEHWLVESIPLEFDLLSGLELLPKTISIWFSGALVSECNICVFYFKFQNTVRSMLNLRT